jgi:hypothetical protein
LVYFDILRYIFAIFSIREKTLFEISAIQPGRADGKVRIGNLLILLVGDAGIEPATSSV